VGLSRIRYNYHLFREQAPVDSQLVFPSLVRIREATGRCVGEVVTDRGFHTATNSEALRATGTYEGMCPRDPKKLSKRMREARFARLQRRRAQTEARIGILKGVFLGRPMRAKGFRNRELALAWGGADAQPLGAGPDAEGQDGGERFAAPGPGRLKTRKTSANRATHGSSVD